MYILILVCESLMSKICQALQHHLKNTIKHATWGVSACRFFAGMTFQRERQKSFGSFGIYPLVICCIISYWTWQFIADIAIKNCIFPYFSIVMFVYQRVHVFKRSGVIKRGWKLPYLCYPAIHLQLGDLPPVAWTLSAKGCSIPEKTVRFKKIYHTPTYPN